MTKTFSTFLMTLIFVMQACSSSTLAPSDAQQTTPEPASALPIATDLVASPTPEERPLPVETPVLEADSGTDAVETNPGLRVFYLRSGNLWSWTEAGGSVQLTDTGDMSTIRVSGDGQLLAFMRGREVYTVRIDGSDARLVDTQADEGGELWFAPNSSSLAVSTSDHIDVVDLKTGGKTTVVTFMTLLSGYSPQIAWMPDSSGFKTIVPSSAEGGQAEMKFVFPDGTMASLAQFALVYPSESPLYFSPDSGFVIYAAKIGDDKETLYLMDSSGATRPYGEPAKSVRAYGWFPDSKRFVYGTDDAQKSFIGKVDGPPTYSETSFFSQVRMMESESYFTLQDGDLFFGNLGGTKIWIDSDVTGFDFLPLK